MPIRPRNIDDARSVELGAAHKEHEHAHADLTGVTSDQHHAEAHNVASHSDTTATGAELETLTDGSDADALHTHGEFDTHTHELDELDATGIADGQILAADGANGAAWTDAPQGAAFSELMLIGA